MPADIHGAGDQKHARGLPCTARGRRAGRDWRVAPVFHTLRLSQNLNQADDGGEQETDLETRVEDRSAGSTLQLQRETAGPGPPLAGQLWQGSRARTHPAQDQSGDAGGDGRDHAISRELLHEQVPKTRSSSTTTRSKFTIPFSTSSSTTNRAQYLAAREGSAERLRYSGGRGSGARGSAALHERASGPGVASCHRISIISVKPMSRKTMLVIAY